MMRGLKIISTPGIGEGKYYNYVIRSILYSVGRWLLRPEYLPTKRCFEMGQHGETVLDLQSANIYLATKMFTAFP